MEKKSTIDTSNHAVLARTILFDLHKAKKRQSNLLKAKNRLATDLSDINEFFDKFIEVARDEKLKLTFKDAVLFSHIVSCEILAYNAKNRVKSLADTKQNKRYVFDSFIDDCFKSGMRLHNDNK